MTEKTVLVTGGAGFIGYHLTKKLLNDGYRIVSVDNMNDYYDPHLKEDRIRDIGNHGGSPTLSAFITFWKPAAIIR